MVIDKVVGIRSLLNSDVHYEKEKKVFYDTIYMKLEN